MKHTVLFFFLLCCNFLHAKDELRYPVASISGSLKNNAHAVVRYDHTTLEIVALNEVRYTRRYAITILDEQGKRFASIREGYSQLAKIMNIEGWLLDAGGRQKERMKLKDMADFSSFAQSYVFHDDNRYKTFSFNYAQYPYTVAFEVEQLFKTTFFLPEWQPQPSHEVAVEEASFTLVYPQKMMIRNKEYLMPPGISREETLQGETMKKTWKLNNINAYNHQHLMQGNFSSPTVILAPGDFQLMEYKGNMDSWKNFGFFMHELNSGRDILPEDKRAVVRAIVEKEPDFRRKIQSLYEYMQQSTRYIANEYGIAGWQTFDAASVSKNGYGDCKGLTNYMKALLKEAGIVSYPALIYAGSEDYYKQDEDFPANNFNHVILCVPGQGDSIWIECTSQHAPAGYLGSFTQNRYALLITENGGVLCRTPVYGKDKSFIIRSTKLDFQKNSKQQTVKLNAKYSGILQDEILSQLKMQPEAKIKEALNTKFTFPSYSIADFRYKLSQPSEFPSVEEEVTAVVSGIISGTEKRIFINLSWIENPMEDITQLGKRTEPFALKQSLRIVDSVTVSLPEDVAVEAIPQMQKQAYPFATYSLEATRSQQGIILVRTYEQNAGVYPADDFERYRTLYKMIEMDKNRLNIVLLNEQ